MANADFDMESPLVGYERSNARLWLALLGVPGFLLIVIVVMSIVIVHMNARNTELAASRVMYAFPDEDGVLQSTMKRPAAAVKRFARDFMANRFTYDPQSVQLNFKRAANMVVPNRAVAVAEQLSELAERVNNLSLSQKFTILEQSELEEIDGGYRFTVRGRIERYVASTFERSYRVETTVRMRKVTPTEARPAGLWVTGVNEARL